MISIFLIVMCIFLVIVSIIDLKFKAIPSILLTGMAIVTVAVNPTNLLYGVLALLLSLMLYEANLIRGVADIKVIAMIGMLISSMFWFSFFAISICFFGLVWQLVLKWRLKLKSNDEIAFLPVFLFVYVSMWILGGFA